MYNKLNETDIQVACQQTQTASHAARIINDGGEFFIQESTRLMLEKVFGFTLTDMKALLAPYFEEIDALNFSVWEKEFEINPSLCDCDDIFAEYNETCTPGKEMVTFRDSRRTEISDNFLFADIWDKYLDYDIEGWSPIKGTGVGVDDINFVVAYLNERNITLVK